MIGPGRTANARIVPGPAGCWLCPFPGVPQLGPAVVSAACAFAVALVRCPWPVPALSSMAWPGMGSFVVGPGVDVLPWRAAASVAGPGRCRGRRRTVESMAMARGAGQVDGGHWPDYHVGMMQAHHPVRDTGRAEKGRHCQGGSRGEDRPGGRARRHHHLHTPDLRVLRLRTRRPAGAGRLVTAWAVAAAPATLCMDRHARFPQVVVPGCPVRERWRLLAAPAARRRRGPRPSGPVICCAGAPRPSGAVAPGRPEGHRSRAIGSAIPPPRTRSGLRIEPAGAHQPGCQQAWRRCVVNAPGGGIAVP